jgi:hypothetical protein
MNPVTSQTHGQIAEAFDQRLLAVLGRQAVTVEAIDPLTTRLKAVPVSAEFSKCRTNLLLRRAWPTGGHSAYVDGDLAYHGSDPALRTALGGPAQGSWRKLQTPLLGGGSNEALCAVLDLLGSPLAGAVRSALTAAAPGADPPLGRTLAAVAEAITPEMAAAAYQACVRQELATQLAVMATRVTLPRGALLWGRPGCGRDHLMLAAAHPLLQTGRVARVFRVAAANLAGGFVFPPEIDGALLRLLADVVAQPGCLLLVQDLDVCLTGSPVSYSLLCNALDRGLCLLATLRSEASLARLHADEGLARRLVAVQVEAPDRREVAQALAHLAGAAGVHATPAAIQTAVRLSAKHAAEQPAAALGLFGAALADATWRGCSEVGPDDVFANQRNDWPQAMPEE